MHEISRENGLYDLLQGPRLALLIFDELLNHSQELYIMHPSHDVLYHITTLDNACSDYIQCTMAYVMSRLTQRPVSH